ncbi:MAG: metalloregulator ArsR/SmtB family transcription factor [Myxococcota bacterium]
MGERARRVALDEVSRDLSILAEPVRVRLLAALTEAELGVSELCRVVQLPQSTVSRHLKALLTTGWIQRRTEGRHAHYVADLAALDGTGRQLWSLVGDAFADTLLAAEDRSRLDAVVAERGDDFFGRVPHEWDAIRERLFGDRFLLSAVAAQLPAEAVLVDLGCGTGNTLLHLAPFVGRAIGVDREPRMLAVARERLRGVASVEWHEAALTDLPLDNAVADYVLCILVLHHVRDVVAALSEARRVLRPGGTVTVVDMVDHDRRDWRQSMGHQHLGFSEVDLAAHAAEAGLRCTRHHPLPPTMEAQGPPLFVATLMASEPDPGC